MKKLLSNMMNKKKFNILVSLFIALEVISESLSYARSNPIASGFEKERSEPERITIFTGETQKFAFAPADRLKVSRKGIVNLFSAGGGFWQVTGIKPGVVMLENEGEAIKRFLIQVRESKTDSDDMDNRSVRESLWDENFHSPKKYFESLCKLTGIICDIKKRQVSGTAPNLDQWLTILSLCTQMKICHFSVMLTEIQKSELKERLLMQFGQAYEVKEQSDNVFKIVGSCGEAPLSKILNDTQDLVLTLKKSGLLVSHCLENDDSNVYEVEIKMIRVEKTQSQNSPGLFRSGRLFRGAGVLEDSLMDQLDRLVETRKAQVVGHPIIHMVNGEKAKIISGGEFAMQKAEVRIHNTGEKALSQNLLWKNTGLEMDLEIKPLPGARLLLNYKSQMRVRLEADSLSVQMIAGAVYVRKGERHFLGKVDFDQKIKNEEEGLFAFLPWIGSWGTKTVESLVRSEVYLWVSIKPSSQFQIHKSLQRAEEQKF